MPASRPLPFRLCAIACALVGLSTLPTTGAHAQSRYSLSMLTLGTAYKNTPVAPLFTRIDAQDRVLATLSYYEGKKFSWNPVTGALTYQDTFNLYPVRYSGTAATLAPTKLVTKPATLMLVSPNGQRLYVRGTNGAPSPIAGSPAWTLEAGNEVGALADNGGVVGGGYRTDTLPSNQPRVLHVPSSWDAGQPRKDLPMPAGSLGGAALAHNTTGLVGGKVFDGSSLTPRATLWRNGALLWQDAGTGGSEVQGVSEQGHALVISYPYNLTADVPSLNTWFENQGAPTPWVWLNGQRTELPCPSHLPRAVAAAISPNGLVVGQCAPAASATSPLRFALTDLPTTPTPSLHDVANGRAWLWQNGAGQELSTTLAAKGVTLPTGMKLLHVQAVNAKGSLAVQGMDANGKSVMLRLLATP